ncbi:MAG: hypothetical protein EOO43_02360 [Flavobacterium sp.]|nr:MAG: hypothetical protein EOO43_02360 [Flavobacterium sp.]
MHKRINITNIIEKSARKKTSNPVMLVAMLHITTFHENTDPLEDPIYISDSHAVNKTLRVFGMVESRFDEIHRLHERAKVLLKTEITALRIFYRLITNHRYTPENIKQQIEAVLNNPNDIGSAAAA